MADFLSLLTSGSAPGAVTAGFRAYNVQVASREEQNNTVVSFQYFPERISDSRAPNYAQKEIPGGSHPLYQFVSGGERVLSFDAVFTNDSSGAEAAGGLIGGVLGFLGGGGGDAQGINNNNRKDVVDIAQVVDELRSYTYPTYKDFVSKPPSLVEFYLPKSGITAFDGNKDSIIGILSRCDVAYEAFHRNGTPRIVVVNLEIREVVQTSTNWQFADWNVQESFLQKRYDRKHIDKI